MKPISSLSPNPNQNRSLPTALMLAALAASALSPKDAVAELRCESPTPFGNTLTVTVSDERTARVELKNAKGVHVRDDLIEKIDEVWDGHGAGLITAPGLSVRYDLWYGVVQNVDVTTDLRGGAIGNIATVSIPRCPAPLRSAVGERRSFQ